VSDSLLAAVTEVLSARWNADAALVSAMGGEHVFSRQVPPDFVFPDAEKQKHGTIGDKTEAGISVMGDGSAITVTSHWWTRGYYVDSPVEQLANLAHAAVMSAPIVVDGYGAFVVRRELLGITGDPDPEYRHGVMRHRFSTLKV
jgi:hypothetical protein